MGRVGIDPLTVRYINFSLWFRRLLSNVSRLRLVSMVVTDPGCLDSTFPSASRNLPESVCLIRFLSVTSHLTCAICRGYKRYCLLLGACGCPPALQPGQ